MSADAVRALLFDLDGTLTDPKPGITGCIRHALEQLGRPSPSLDELARYIGPPLRETFAELLGTRNPARIEDAILRYRERFATVGLFENAVYEGIPETLAVLQGQVDVLYVATAKPTIYARRIIAHFGLGGFFREVYGAGLDGRHDDKAELVAHLLQTEGLTAASVVMIGDREMDMRAACRNGLRGVGVSWGYGSEEELREAGASALCHQPCDLPAVLAPLISPPATLPRTSHA